MACWTLFLRAPFFVQDHLGWDEGLYYTISGRLLHGARLYTDFWDNKPVGIYLIYSALLALSGGSIQAIVLASSIAVCVTASLLGVIAWKVFGSPRAGLIAALLFPAYMLDMGADGANAENFFVPLTALSVLWLGTRLDRKADARNLAAHGFVFGLIQGLALQIKFLVLFETALLGCVFAFLVWRSGGRRLAGLAQLAAGFVTGFLLPTLLVLAWFAWAGRLDALVFSNFVSPRLYVDNPFGLNDPAGTIAYCIRKVSYFAPLMVMAALMFAGRLLARKPVTDAGAAPLALVLAWLCGTFLGAVSTGQNSYHYFIVLAAPLCLLAGLTADMMLARLGGGSAKLAAVLVLLMAWPLYFHVAKTWRRLHDEMPNPDWAIAAEIGRHAPPGAPIWVLGQSPSLYGLSGMVPATRYPFAWHITDRPRAYGVDPAAEIERIFARTPALVALPPHWIEERYDDTGARIRRHLDADYLRLPLAPEWRDHLVLFKRARGNP